MGHEFIPQKIERYILNFCNDLVEEGIPELVPINPWRESKVKECHLNTERFVKENQGSEIVYGWIIAVWKPYLIEGIFHSVIREKDGALLDITPGEFSNEKTLFLADPNRRFEGIQINNFRKPLVATNLVKEYIRLMDEFHAVTNEGKLAYQYGKVAVPIDKINPILERVYVIEGILNKPNSIPANSECPCGSNRKYKKCCKI